MVPIQTDVVGIHPPCVLVPETSVEPTGMLPGKSHPSFWSEIKSRTQAGVEGGGDTGADVTAGQRKQMALPEALTPERYSLEAQANTF